MADPFYTCCEDGMLSQVQPTDHSGLCPACKPQSTLRQLTDEELAECLRAPGTLTWGQCRNMVDALRAQSVVAYGVPVTKTTGETNG